MKKLIFIICLIAPTLAAAETMTLKYNGYWEGIKAAEVGVHNVEDGAGNYTLETDTSTLGIVKSLTNFKSHTMTKGIITDNAHLPVTYDSAWQTKKNSPHIIVTYSYSGENLISEVADPPENRNKRPIVEQQYKVHTLDPISAFFAARDAIRDSLKANDALPHSFKITVFDARRVFDANFKIIGYENKKIDGVSQKLLHITLNRTAIAGFNKKELDKLKNFNPVFDIYVDENYIPIIGYGQAVIGSTEMRLVSQCLGDSCK